MNNSNLKKEKKQFFNTSDKKLLKKGAKKTSVKNEVHFIQKNFLQRKKETKPEIKRNDSRINKEIILNKEIVLLLDSINNQLKLFKKIVLGGIIIASWLLLLNLNKINTLITTSNIPTTPVKKTATSIAKNISENNPAFGNLIRDVIIFLVIGLVIVIIIKWLAKKSEKW